MVRLLHPKGHYTVHSLRSAGRVTVEIIAWAGSSVHLDLQNRPNIKRLPFLTTKQKQYFSKTSRQFSGNKVSYFLRDHIFWEAIKLHLFHTLTKWFLCLNLTCVAPTRPHQSCLFFQDFVQWCQHWLLISLRHIQLTLLDEVDDALSNVVANAPGDETCKDTPRQEDTEGREHTVRNHRQSEPVDLLDLRTQTEATDLFWTFTQMLRCSRNLKHPHIWCSPRPHTHTQTYTFHSLYITQTHSV